MYLYSVSGLLSGARSILYDGSPVVPSPVQFLDLLGRLQVTHFGTSAHYLSLLESSGVTAKDTHNLNRLKVITSTEYWISISRSLKNNICLGILLERVG